MPTYSYRCPRGHLIEIQGKMHDERAEKISCVECLRATGDVVAARRSFQDDNVGLSMEDARIGHGYMDQSICPVGDPENTGGTYIRNKKHRKELLKKYGMRQKHSLD